MWHRKVGSNMAKSDKSGCGAAVLAFLAFAVVVAVLSAIWGLLAVLAIASFAAAFVLHKKKAGQTDDEKRDDDSFYTQQCPNCGAQIQVSEYERNARCQYCDSAFAAERTPLQRPVPEEKTGLDKLLADPVKALTALGAILLVLSLIGFAFAGSRSSSDSSSDSPTSSVSAASNTETSSASAAKTGSVNDVKLTPSTEYLEYSNKETDPVSLVECNMSDAKISADSKIDLSTVGKQSVEYTVLLNGESRDAKVDFTVRDTKKPVITLSDDNPKIDQGADFDPASAIKSVDDPIDGALGRVDAAPTPDDKLTPGLNLFYDAGWYVIDGAIDTNTPGTYSFAITASDKHGNVATKELLVTVNAPAQEEPAVAEQSAPTYTYIVNANSGKFHISGCRDVSKMKDSNKIEITATRQEMLDMGYSPCKHCNP